MVTNEPCGQALNAGGEGGGVKVVSKGIDCDSTFDLWNNYF